MAENNDTLKISDEDYILLGKMFVDFVAHKGMPLTAESFSENKTKLAKEIEVTEEKVIELYQILFLLSMEQSLGKFKSRTIVGFKKD